MVYSEAVNVRAQASGIAVSKDIAKAFVERLVMQTVFDVLEQQGRNALLPDAIISSILAQLKIQINYDPLECKGATVNGDLNNIMGMPGMIPHCVIVGNTVTATCPERNPRGAGANVMCMVGVMDMDVEAISANYTTVLGTLTITNVIMANWSRDMWQTVVNRAVRMLAASPFSSQFSSASGTVN
ncbi:hypothetical protein KIN20_016387 [Parelaphostrongylus tenuis]|uniref:Uncharacterized protein n=1 Tax=Parelaphostrongylus tenuis TaxID=148309 RepID=A0AAD5QMX0_PARTN|nr:hypothetical protein KIN20_016387 [Parelaphostrongylus tenuis]